MNIGIVTTWFERGAAYVSRAYRDVLLEQHEVFIYARAGEKYAQGDPNWDNDKVTWGKRVEHKDITHIDRRDFERWIKKNQLDVIIFNEQHSWDIITHCVQNLDITIGAYIDYYKPETVKFFRLYDFLLCNTKRHYSVFDDHPQAFYIPWGTDLEVFKPTRFDDLRNEITFFHSAGMDVFRKGTDVVIEAFRRVSGPVWLVLHVQHNLPPHSAIQRAATDDPRIRIISGEVSAPGLYHLGDVYVYPTRLEGIGLTIAEALACGLPVITTNAPPMNEFVEDPVSGRLVTVEKTLARSDGYYWPESLCNIDSLTQAMQSYVVERRKIAEYQSAARAHAEKSLNWAANAANLSEMMRNVQRRRDSSPVLLREAQQYYRENSPAYLKSMLIKWGARKLKHRLLRR